MTRFVSLFLILHSTIFPKTYKPGLGRQFPEGVEVLAASISEPLVQLSTPLESHVTFFPLFFSCKEGVGVTSCERLVCLFALPVHFQELRHPSRPPSDPPGDTSELLAKQRKL